MVEYTQQSLQSRLHHRYRHASAGRAQTFYERIGEVSWRNLGKRYESAVTRAKALYDLWLLPGVVCILLISENDELFCTNLLALLVLGAVPVLSATPVLRGHHTNLKNALQHLIGKLWPSMVLAEKPLRVRLGSLKINNFGMTKNIGGATLSDPKRIFVADHLDNGILFKREIAVSVSVQLGVKAREAILLSEKMMMTNTSSDMHRHRYYRELYMNDALQSVFQSRW